MSEEIQPKIVTILPVGEERENARKLYKFTTLSMNKKKKKSYISATYDKFNNCIILRISKKP